LKIGIDIDSTLNTLDVEWAAWVRENGDPNFYPESILTWDTHKYTTIGKKVYDYLHIDGAFRNLGIRPFAQSVVHKLHLAGHEILVVSSCDPAKSWAEKYEWVGEHFPFIQKKNRIACSRKGLLKLDVLIDDGPHNFDEFEGLAIVMDQPWNRQYDGERAYNWVDVERKLIG
jgi:5'(3')-deoxyribonucleotidase